MVYDHILYTDTEDTVTLSTHAGTEDLRVPPPLGHLAPYTIVNASKTPHFIHGKLMIPFRRPIPAIWQVNQAIRQECRPLYVSRHLMADLSEGFNPNFIVNEETGSECWVPGTELFKRFLWDTLETFDERYTIKTLVLRDYALVSAGEGVEFGSEGFWKVIEEVLNVRKGETANIDAEREEVMVQIPIFRLSLSPRGDGFTVSTPLQLRDKECENVQRWLDEDVGCVAKRDKKVFDGRDVLAMMKFLNESQKSPWPKWNDEWNTARFKLVVSKENVEVVKEKKVAKEFGYIAASAKLGGGQSE